MLKYLQAMKIKLMCQNKVHLSDFHAGLLKGLKQNKLQLCMRLHAKTHENLMPNADFGTVPLASCKCSVLLQAGPVEHAMLTCIERY